MMERVPRTMAPCITYIVLTWIIALPIGILSALKKYTFWDYFFTFLSFLGLSIPPFLLALVLLYIVFVKTGYLATGLFSPAYENAPWSLAKIAHLMKNVWLPLL